MTDGLAPSVVDATPEKSFFIHMITRDIELEDCILDLLDNSIDGALRLRGSQASWQGLTVRIEFDPGGFSITDNCGGISLEVARNYAFHFGRPKAAASVDRAIGLYGVGMKRAVFKLGKAIEVASSTGSEAFRVRIDVNEWESTPEWKFPVELIEPGPAGTSLTVKNLNPEVSEEFAGPLFADTLRQTISRDYSLFIQHGLRVVVNQATVPVTVLRFREGESFKAAKLSYQDGGVTVRLVAGMAAPPPDDPDETTGVEADPYYGWFVLCNDRVVKAANKDEDTVWGDHGFTRWHPQYRGFLGIAGFEADDPSLLPWTTTKRELDKTAAVYRRAVKRMKDLTEQWVKYTRKRKRAPDKARAAEQAALPKAEADVGESSQMGFPEIPATPEIGYIQYTKPKADIVRVATALGDPDMSFVDVGTLTFDYFFDREVDK